MNYDEWVNSGKRDRLPFPIEQFEIHGHMETILYDKFFRCFVLLSARKIIPLEQFCEAFV